MWIRAQSAFGSVVYRWLRPLVRDVGVNFTLHMARHYVGKRMNAEGQGLKTITAALDHADPQSSVRYQDADLDVVRRSQTGAEAIILGGKSGGKVGKRR